MALQIVFSSSKWQICSGGCALMNGVHLVQPLFPLGHAPASLHAFDFRCFAISGSVLLWLDRLLSDEECLKDGLRSARHKEPPPHLLFLLFLGL